MLGRLTMPFTTAPVLGALANMAFCLSPLSSMEETPCKRKFIKDITFVALNSANRRNIPSTTSQIQYLQTQAREDSHGSTSVISVCADVELRLHQTEGSDPKTLVMDGIWMISRPCR